MFSNKSASRKKQLNNIDSQRLKKQLVTQKSYPQCETIPLQEHDHISFKTFLLHTIRDALIFSRNVLRN